ncbi:MAG TPA: TonB-dependent receptor plug domain-containing protein, partial [Nevskiaceae bacterium]|nr:TonB-dependent receptor plug domain-containing protein [Nevskiaceae bacterium]
MNSALVRAAWGLAWITGASAQEPAADAVPVVPVDATAPAPTDSTDAPPAARGVGAGIGEIVVTAQRKAETVQDIPIAISVFAGEDLEKLGVTDTRDLGKVVPGFHFADNGYGSPVYSLRGIGFNDYSYSSAG